MSHDEAAELLAVFALDALDDDEHEMIEAHLGRVPALSGRARRPREVAAALGNSVEPLPRGCGRASPAACRRVATKSRRPCRPSCAIRPPMTPRPPPPLPPPPPPPPHSPATGAPAGLARSSFSVASLAVAAAAVAAVLGISLVHDNNQISAPATCDARPPPLPLCGCPVTRS